MNWILVVLIFTSTGDTILEASGMTMGPRACWALRDVLNESPKLDWQLPPGVKGKAVGHRAQCIQIWEFKEER